MVISITDLITGVALVGIDDLNPCNGIHGNLSLSHKMMKHAVSRSVNSQNVERGARILGSRSEATSWIDIYLSRHKDQPQP